jgi:hypothetical protein
MKLKSLLFLAGAAGAIAAVVKRQGGAQQLVDAAPQPVKDAAQTAGQTVQRAVENAPEPVKQAVDKVTPGDSDATQAHQRYEPPVEGLAQTPTEAGGPPSDDTPVSEAAPRTPESGEDLHFPEHDLPEDVVMPDTSDDDPLVRQQEKAAAGDAASIGGSVDSMAAQDASYPDDPAMRPVVEGAGDENEETFETREGIERGNRETET